MWRLKRNRGLWFGIRLLFAGTAVFFLVRTVVIRWPQIKAYGWDLRVGPLVASMLLQLTALLVWATVWRRMVVRTGCLVGWLAGIRIYVVSNLARYIPGSIWGYVSRAYLGEEDGLTLAGVGISVAWEVGSAVLASFLLIITILPTYKGEIHRVVLWVVLTAALVILVGLLPPVFNRWAPFLKHMLPTDSLPPFRWMDFLLYLASALGTHVLVGTAFFLFTQSLFDVSWQAWWDFVVLWSFSATAGLLIVFVPYGLGVREGLLAILLGQFLPDEVAALASLSSRVWTIIGEVIAATAIVLVSHYLRQSGEDNP